MKIRVRNTIKLDIEGAAKTYAPSWTVYKIDDKVAKKKNYSQRFRKYPEHIEIVEDVAEEVKPAVNNEDGIPEGSEKVTEGEVKESQEKTSQILGEEELSQNDQQNAKDSDENLSAPELKKKTKKAAPKKSKKKNEE